MGLSQKLRTLPADKLHTGIVRFHRCNNRNSGKKWIQYFQYDLKHLLYILRSFYYDLLRLNHFLEKYQPTDTVQYHYSLKLWSFKPFPSVWTLIIQTVGQIICYALKANSSKNKHPSLLTSFLIYPLYSSIIYLLHIFFDLGFSCLSKVKQPAKNYELLNEASHTSILLELFQNRNM